MIHNTAMSAPFIYKLSMTKYTFFTIQNGIPYHELKKPLTFENDPFGISNWVLRFPLIVYSKDLLERHLFTEDSVTISVHCGTIEEQRWKYFVTTKSDGSHLYCTAQIFYEKAFLSKCLRLKMGKEGSQEGQRQEFYIPKCLVVMSAEPFFKMHVNLLRIYRQIVKPNPIICHPISPKIISSYLRLKGQGRTEEFNLVQSAQEGKRAKQNMILDYYVQKMNEHRDREMLLVQKYTNLPVLHLYPLRSNQLFQFSHFFSLPLSSQTLSTVVTALLLEKQIVVASKSSNQALMVIESLLEIIKPLRWQHMLVHNLPSHMLDAANENFMPFIVGINQKHLPEINHQNKFIVLVEEDKIIEPQQIILFEPLQQFSSKIAKKTSPSLINEKHIISLSIQFMCRLLQPLYQNRLYHQNSPFYAQFMQTSLYSHFTQQIEKNQLSDFVDLLNYQQPQERIMRIQRQLNDLTYSFQNPKHIFNEIEWIEYYLSRTNPTLALSKSQKENKLVSLKEIKNGIINQTNKPQTTRQSSAINRIRSQSTIQQRSSKSGQKIKVSMVRHDYCHPVINQLLQQRLGVCIKMP